METKVIFLMFYITAVAFGTSSIPDYIKLDASKPYRTIGNRPIPYAYDALPPPRRLPTPLPPVPPEQVVFSGSISDTEDLIPSLPQSITPFIDSDYWKSRRGPGEKGVAIHPDGSTSFVGTTTHGIGKRSTDDLLVEESRQTTSVKELVPEDPLTSESSGKRLLPFHHKYYAPYNYYYPYSRYYSSTDYPDYIPEADRYKYRYHHPYNYHPYGYGSYRGYYPFYNNYFPYGRPHHPSYYDYWKPEVIEEDLKKGLATKEVSVHPKGGVSYVSRRIHGTG